jgi:hypothetical protein
LAAAGGFASLSTLPSLPPPALFHTKILHFQFPYIIEQYFGMALSFYV